MRSINMSTTTIRLDDELKARIAAAAARSDKSSHAFILEALSDLVERSELDEELHRIADKRWAALQRTGESVAWEDAAAYLKARAAGKKVRRPAARRPGP
ncbi:putative transcriptional regulator [Variovorax boronicumulans]|nr:putative transcriptional regulator [Variovorax boronicumulans]